MTSLRPYRHPDDYGAVDRFLIESYESGNSLRNWLQPRWEYMHSFTSAEHIDLGRIGVAEDGGRIVGLIHPEDAPAFAYVQVRPGFEAVKPALVDWAEDRLGGRSRTLERDVLGIYVDLTDIELRTLLANRGFEEAPEWGEQHARLLLDDDLPPAPLSEGFTLQSLADDNDLAKVNRVLWRGFNHDGPPPDEIISMRDRAQRTPNYDKDLNLVVVAPDGSFASYAGIWYVPENRVAYVEPVATDPDYRRMGLGRAAVVEAVRRTRQRGAYVAWVGSDQAFYLNMGFEIVARSTLWLKDRPA